jgi:hypothetical protein
MPRCGEKRFPCSCVLVYPSGMDAFAALDSIQRHGLGDIADVIAAEQLRKIRAGGMPMTPAMQPSMSSAIARNNPSFTPPTCPPGYELHVRLGQHTELTYDEWLTYARNNPGVRDSVASHARH